MTPFIRTAFLASCMLAFPAQAAERPFAQNPDKQSAFVNTLLKKDGKIKTRDVMRVVSNVFDFRPLMRTSDLLAQHGWQNAARAVVRLANESPADFDFVDCVAGHRMARPVSAAVFNLDFYSMLKRDVRELQKERRNLPSACRFENA